MEVSNHHPRLTVDSNSHHNNINNNNISQQQLVDRTSRLKLGNPEKMENGNGGVYQLPVVHPIVSTPRCEACTTKSTTSFFDFECPQCEALVTDVHQQQQPTSIAQLMAIARQWTPAVQGRMNLLIMEMLRRGAHADDRDGLTDMTLLHFAVKSGAAGLGNAEAAMALAEYLVETAHADATLRCRWNDTTALHIATFYDVAPVVGYLVSVLASSAQGAVGALDVTSSVLEGRTALHIAAANLCLRSAKVLIGAGANVLAKDRRGRTPLDCVPNVEDDSSSIFNNNKTLRDNAHQLRTIFKEMAPTTTVSTSPTATTVAAEDNDEENDEEQPCSLLLLNQSLLKNQQVSKQNSSSSSSSSFRSSSTYQEAIKTAKVVLSALGIQIGDRVVVGNAKVGVLRYCGPTQFASGIWTGVELDEPIGKHDGTLDGVPYFVCPPKHGIFAPLNKISKLDYDDLDMIGPGGGGFSGVNDTISGSGSAFRSPSALVVTVPCKQYSSSPVAGTNGYRRWYHSYSASGIDMSAVQPKIDTGLGGGGGNVGRSSLGGRFSDHNGHHHHHHHQNGLISSSTSGGGECSVNSEDVHLGSRVYLSDKKTGVVRFIGSTAFAGGIWYGVELTRPLGKHDGAVQGVRYFTCPEGYGVFVPLSRIARLLPPTAPKPTGYSRRTIASISTSTTTTTTTKRQVITTSTSTPEEINSGDETGSEMSLTVSNTSSLDVNINSHHHHPHHPNSKQSPSTLAAVTTNGHHHHHHHQNHQSNLEPWRSPSAFMPKSADTSASSSTTASSSSAFKFPDTRMVSSSSNLLGSSTGGGATFRRTMSLRRAGSVRSKPIGGGVAQEQQQPQQPSWLRIGVNVLVNGQFATLRYIGKVHFTEGTFLGVELRTPTGKNDGTIDGVRYFICKPNCGLLVRPQKVTVRGISAAKLLPEEAAVLLPTRRNGAIIGKSKEI